MAEIYTHKGFIEFFQALATANAKVDEFYRMDLSEIIKNHTEQISEEVKTVMILERDESHIQANDGSHIHKTHTAAFSILTVASGTQEYIEHDDIYHNNEQVCFEILDQIHQQYVDGIMNGIPEITYFKYDGIKILKIGPTLGGRYGVRVQFHFSTKSYPVNN